MRVIEADKLIMKDLGNGNYLVTEEAMRNAPTFEAEPVRHVQWIVGMDGRYMCSECGKVFRYEIGNYCSICGAKLEYEEA